MSEIVLAPADRVSVAERAALMTAIYADYFVPMRLTPDLVRAMDRFYDVDLPASAVALHGDEPIGTVLLSRRDHRGWISGVGVVPRWRRSGVGRQMMIATLDRAQRAGLVSITLEVITQNTAAIALYAGLGFSAGRELLSWRRPADADLLPIPAEAPVNIPVGEALMACAAWQDQRPSWQGEADTLHHMAARLRGYRLDLDGAPAGYCVVSDYGDAVGLMDVGLPPQADGLWAGRTLLQALAHLYRGRALSIINVPADDRLCRVLAALHFLVTVRQIEMALKTGL